MNRILPIINLKRLLECRLISTRISADGKDVPKRKTFENRITLINVDNSVAITDLKNAQNLSLKRELKLVKIQDVSAKTQRPVYKLMTNADYHAEELQKRKEKQTARQSGALKSPKLLTLSSRIGEHDLMTNIKKMLKLIDKDHEVRVILTADNSKESNILEDMYAQIEKNIKISGRLLQKRLKGNNMKFQIVPLKNKSSQSKQDSSGSDEEVTQSDKGPQ